jgi:hypothetical protein
MKFHFGTIVPTQSGTKAAYPILYMNHLHR